MARTEGAKELGAWLRQRRMKQVALAEHLNVSAPTVSRWVSGEDRPEPAFREALRIMTGIETSAWLSPSELRLIERSVPMPETVAEPAEPGDVGT